MADPTLTDLLDAIAAMHAEIRTSFVADWTDREKLGADIRDAIARVQPDITSLLPDRRPMNSSVTPFDFEGQRSGSSTATEPVVGGERGGQGVEDCQSSAGCEPSR